MAHKVFSWIYHTDHAFLIIVLIFSVRLVESLRVHRSIDTRYRVEDVPQSVTPERVMPPMALESRLTDERDVVTRSTTGGIFTRTTPSPPGPTKPISTTSQTMSSDPGESTTESPTSTYEPPSSTHTPTPTPAPAPTSSTTTPAPTSTTTTPAPDEPPQECPNTSATIILVAIVFLAINILCWLAYCYLHASVPKIDSSFESKGHKSLTRKSLTRKSLTHKSASGKRYPSQATALSTRSELPIRSPKRLIYESHTTGSKISHSKTDINTPRSPITNDSKSTTGPRSGRTYSNTINSLSS